MTLKLGDTVQHTDEYGISGPECVIEDFRETEIVARDPWGYEWRFDPRDLSTGALKLIETPLFIGSEPSPQTRGGRK